MNAVKFTAKGGRVQVHLLRVNSHVEITVSDTGEGIAPDVLPFVFERFRQADSSTTRAHAGLGLGLALVKHLVELHGGSVEAQSAGKDMGSTFTVTLPLPIADAGRPEPRASIRPPRRPTTVPAGARLDGLRVLVVDDDPDALELAATILADSRRQRPPVRLGARGARRAARVAAGRPDLGHRDARRGRLRAGPEGARARSDRMAAGRRRSR